MSKVQIMTVLTFALGLALAGVAASGSHKTERSYAKDLAELRAKFNADKGRVRLLMLLSPT